MLCVVLYANISILLILLKVILNHLSTNEFIKNIKYPEKMGKEENRVVYILLYSRPTIKII